MTSATAILDQEVVASIAKRVEMESSLKEASDQGVETSSEGSSPATSRASSSDDLTRLEKKKGDTSQGGGKRRLKDRSRIPPSAFLSVTLIVGLQYYAGVYNFARVFASLKRTVLTSSRTAYDLMAYLRDLCQSIASGELRSVKEYVFALASVLIVGSILYILIYVPLRAGMWTGARSNRHKMHRYMGLLFLIQYGLVWIEYLTNYEEAGHSTYLPHFIAVNGIIQAWSAYFSFKVLPELDDAGYYSDRAVVSRNFVHENVFYQLMTVFGSMYYNDILRENLQSTVPGRFLELLFVFLPYAAFRMWFPVTRFKDAGTSMSGRSARNEKFYSVGTQMVKFFYLWAKYFLGFYINWLVFLGVASEANMRFIRGLFLLNMGTVSIAIFLHTLRFKKVLPPRLTFSVYLAQIYATFSAIPYAYEMFAAHKKLSALALFGVACNMTRSRKVHAAWCALVVYFLAFSEVEW